MPAPPPALTVSQVNRTAKALLEQELSDLWVEGEVSSATYHGSGHLYFKLKDEACALDAVMWRSGVRRLRFRLERGRRVQVHGSLTIYDRSGRYQIVVDAIREAGLGDLLRQLEELKARLRAEGLFERERPLPLLPRRVGLVTSPTGAALSDVVCTIHRRAPGVPVVLSPARVQGPGAAEDVVRALTHLLAHTPCDVVVVGRGGGSLEDLMPFNDEGLVRAVAACPVPVVSAVGHEVDFTLCDLAADRRAKTPTEAGEFVAPDVAALRGEVRATLRRGASAARRTLRDHALGLAEAERRLHACHPRVRLERGRAELEALKARLAGQPRARLERERAALAGLSGRLDALSPLRVLDRGYALVRDEATGTLVRDAAEVAPGDELAVRLARGRLAATVDRVERGA